MIQVWSVESLPVTRWRNGGGETREIIAIAGPQGSDFLWRASIATLDKDGPFSSFNGIDRVITLLEGAGVTLTVDGKEIPLALHTPQPFSGDSACAARITGQSRDFNIMTLRGACSAHVAVADSAQQSRSGVCLVLSGEWQLNGSELVTGMGAWWHNEHSTIRPVSAGGKLLFCSIEEG